MQNRFRRGIKHLGLVFGTFAEFCRQVSIATMRAAIYTVSLFPLCRQLVRFMLVSPPKFSLTLTAALLRRNMKSTTSRITQRLVACSLDVVWHSGISDCSRRACALRWPQDHAAQPTACGRVPNSPPFRHHRGRASAGCTLPLRLLLPFFAIPRLAG